MSAPRSGAPRGMTMECVENTSPIPVGDESLGRSARWMQTGGERAAPKRLGEVRCKPPIGQAWLRDRMVSESEAGFNLRKRRSLPRHILHNWDSPSKLIRGSDRIQWCSSRGWLRLVTRFYQPKRC